MMGDRRLCLLLRSQGSYHKSKKFLKGEVRSLS